MAQTASTAQPSVGRTYSSTYPSQITLEPAIMRHFQGLADSVPVDVLAQLLRENSAAVSRALVNGFIASPPAATSAGQPATTASPGVVQGSPPTMAPLPASFGAELTALEGVPKMPLNEVEKALSQHGSIRKSKLAAGSIVLSASAGCPGLNYLLDWVEGLGAPAVPNAAGMMVALSVHLQRTTKGFGLQIGYSTDLRRLVVEGVYEFVQSSNGWPVCRGDVLTAVDKYALEQNNNGQWLIDNVVKTFGSITHTTCVSFNRPITTQHASLLMAIRRSLVRLLKLEQYAMKYYRGPATKYLQALLGRLNSAYSGVYTLPCGQLGSESKNNAAADGTTASDRARLAEWHSLATALAREVNRLENGLYVVPSTGGVPVVLSERVPVTALGVLVPTAASGYRGDGSGSVVTSTA